MPINSPVHKMFEALKSKGFNASSAAKISQKKTGLSLKTGKKPERYNLNIYDPRHPLYQPDKEYKDINKPIEVKPASNESSFVAPKGERPPTTGALESIQRAYELF